MKQVQAEAMKAVGLAARNAEGGRIRPCRLA